MLESQYISTYWINYGLDNQYYLDVSLPPNLISYFKCCYHVLCDSNRIFTGPTERVCQCQIRLRKQTYYLEGQYYQYSQCQQTNTSINLRKATNVSINFLFALSIICWVVITGLSTAATLQFHHASSRCQETTRPVRHATSQYNKFLYFKYF